MDDVVLVEEQCGRRDLLEDLLDFGDGQGRVLRVMDELYTRGLGKRRWGSGQVQRETDCASGAAVWRGPFVRLCAQLFA